MRPRPIVRHEATGPAAVLRGTRQRVPSDAPILIEVDNLSISYLTEDGKPAARAVENVSFTLREGELMGLVGESGCGKTTLMLGLLRLLPAAGQIVDGEVWFGDTELTALTEEEMEAVRWKGISIVFQGAMNALNPVRSVGDQIAEAIVKHEPHMQDAALEARVSELLDLVGISPEHKKHFPHQYSGGMRQRAMIAMALACNPKVVIADEPTTALDVMIQAQVLELLELLRKRLGLSIIFVTHDLGVVAEMCDSVLVMYGGVTAEYSDVDTIYNLAQHPYTQELLKAFPDLSQPEKRLASIPGYPPRLDDLPAGCRFAPRCPAAFERCRVEQPAIHQLSERHYASCHLVEENSLTTKGAHLHRTQVQVSNTKEFPLCPFVCFVVKGIEMQDYFLEVHDLKKYFSAGRPGLFNRRVEYIHAVDGVDLQLKRGEVVAMVGESGCGKSTLALTLMGLEEPTSGTIIFESKEITHANEHDRKLLRQRIQMVFQDPYESLNPTQTIGEIVGEPLDVHGLTHTQV